MKLDETVLEINLNALEEDCLGQPKLMFLWGQKLATARARSKETNNKLKLLAAEISTAVRSDPSSFGLEKITEDGVKSCVLCAKKYQEAQEAVVTAEHEEDILDVFVKSLTDRKQELSNLVALHGQMYWSKPSMTKHSSNGRDRVTDRVTKELNKK